MNVFHTCIIKNAILPMLVVAALLAGISSMDVMAINLTTLPFEEVSQYDVEKSRKPLSTIENAIREANPEELRGIEQGLIGILTHPSATPDAQQFSCRMLLQAGSEASIPALSKALLNPELFDYARLALERLPSAKVDNVFRSLLKKSDGETRLGLLSSIAIRRDEKAVSLITKYLKSDDTALLSSVIKALGRIGGSQAASALDGTTVAEDLQDELYDSLLLCADSFLQHGDNAAADKIYHRLSGNKNPVMIRVAAYNGLVKTRRFAATGMIVNLLKDNNWTLRQAAANLFVMDLPGSERTEALIKVFSSLKNDTKILVLKTFASRRDPLALETIVKATEDDNQAVGITAIETLAILGDASHAGHLAELCSQGGAVGSAAENAIVALRGNGTDNALRTALLSNNEKIRAAMIRCLIRRNADGLLATLLDHTQDQSALVRSEAIRGLAPICGDSELRTLITLVLEARSANERNLAQESLRALVNRMDNKSKFETAMAAILPTAPNETKPALMAFMAEFGGVYAGKAIEHEFKSKDQKISDAAFDALVRWPDATPMNTLEAVARNAKDAKKREAALTGFLHSIRLSSSSNLDSTMKKYQSAMSIARTAKEKAQVISAVAQQESLASLEFLEKYLDDKQVSTQAKDAYIAMVKSLQSSEVSKESMKLSASHNPRGLQRAIDGNMGTRWETGTSQVPGMWLQIDFGAAIQLQKVIFDSTGSNSDFPAAYHVQISPDGSSWETIAKANGQRPKLEIDTKGKSTRWLKIEQTGKKDGLFWSIHEISAFKTSDQAKLKHAQDVLKKLEK
jgi:HEAT repeat protein